MFYFILFFLDYIHSNSEPYIAWLFSNIKKLYHVDEVNNLEVDETTWKGFILEWLCIRNGNKKLIHTLLTIKYLNINQIINKRNILLSIAMSIDKNNINRNNRKMIFILKYLITQSNIDLEYVKFPYSKIPDTIFKLSDQEIRNYIDKYNKELADKEKLTQ